MLNASRAYWFESGTVNGLLYNNKPTGTYWMYKWYGDMAGDMVPVTPAGSQDGVASYDSTRKIVNVVFGGDSGSNSVQVNGLTPLGSSVKAVLSYTPDSGRLANVTAPDHGLDVDLPGDQRERDGAHHQPERLGRLPVC